jgi:hypothetical protein
MLYWQEQLGLELHHTNESIDANIFLSKHILVDVDIVKMTPEIYKNSPRTNDYID